MKKIFTLILVLLLVLTMVSACVELDAVTKIKYKLEDITKATTIKQTIEVLAGTEILSLQENTYKVTGQSVELTSQLTELNPDYPTDGQKHVTSTDTSVLTLEQLHAKIPHKINLKMENIVDESYNEIVSGNTITHKMTILPEHVSAFLDISQQQAQTVTNLLLSVVEYNELITSLTLQYTSTTGNSVTIVYSFTY